MSIEHSDNAESVLEDYNDVILILDGHRFDFDLNKRRVRVWAKLDRSTAARLARQLRALGWLAFVREGNLEAFARDVSWRPFSMGGRARSGADSSGSVIHAVPCNPHSGGALMGPAFCGTRPGSGGFGWLERKADVSCPMCKRNVLPSC